MITLTEALGLGYFLAHSGSRASPLQALGPVEAGLDFFPPRNPPCVNTSRPRTPCHRVTAEGPALLSSCGPMSRSMQHAHRAWAGAHQSPPATRWPLRASSAHHPVGPCPEACNMYKVMSKRTPKPPCHKVATES